MKNSTPIEAISSGKPLPALHVGEQVTTLGQARARLGNPYAMQIVDADGVTVALVPWPAGERKKADALAARLAAANDLVNAAKDAAFRLREFVRDRFTNPSVEDLVEVHALDEAIRKAEARA
jgi:hypothetical protein